MEEFWHHKQQEMLEEEHKLSDENEVRHIFSMTCNIDMHFTLKL